MIKSSFYLAIFIILMLSCTDKNVISDLAPGLIENQTFDFTVLIEGHQYDSTVIRNCTFENIDGDGLLIRDVDHLIIENCTFRDITEKGIRFSNTGSSKGVVISNNEIFNIGQSGIQAAEGHLECLITNNKIYNVATKPLANQFSSPHHGIYFKGLGVTILNNEIYDVINEMGNCISIRTSGLVSGNRLSGATDHGVSYYSDADAMDGELIIENNIIFDNGERGVQLVSNGNSYNHISTATVRFNTLVSADRSLIGVNIFLDDVQLDFYGNILIREDEVDILIFSDLAVNTEKNLESFTDVGFVDYEGRDFHLANNSSAIDFATGVPDHPAVDFEGDIRTAASLDAGADQW